MKLAGSALTVEVRPGDNLMIHAAIAMAKPGDVLVIDGKGDQGAALMGTIMMTACKKLGIAGVVMDGACRDSLEIDEMDFPVFSVGTNPNGPTKNIGGRIGHPVSIGGVTVNPGDFVIGDGDGVVVVEREKIESLLPLAPRRSRTRPRASPPSRGRHGRQVAGLGAAHGRRAEGRRDAVSAILVTGADLAPQALALLEGYEVVYAGKTPTEDDLVALCRTHDPVAIIVRYGKVGAAVMDAAPSLQGDLQARQRHRHHRQGRGEGTRHRGGAAVGANAAAVAEQALALLLACAKSVVALDARMHAGHWDKATHKSLELGGRTIGLVGLGAIGLRFARMADALGMRVMASIRSQGTFRYMCKPWTWRPSGPSPMPSRCTAR
jgi:hypothetical protein